MIRENSINPLRYATLTTCLYLFSLSAPADSPQRCLIRDKVVITNLSCEQLTAEAGISASAPNSSPPPQRMDKPAVAPPLPLTPPHAIKAGQNSPLKESLLPIFFNGVSPFVAALAIIALLAAWLKISVDQALRKRSRERPPLPRAAIEPTIAPDLPPEEVLPYRQAPVMSRYELELFQRLKAALPECEIFPQVPLAGFIRIDRQRAGSAYRSNNYRWQSRISQQRVDFLACRRQDMAILSAIELDDPSHEAAEARQRDEKKNKSLQDANIPLIRWRVEAMPDQDEIRQEFVRRGLLNPETPGSFMPADGGT